MTQPQPPAGMESLPLSAFDREHGLKYHWIRKGTKPPKEGVRCRICFVLLMEREARNKGFCKMHGGSGFSSSIK